MPDNFTCQWRATGRQKFNIYFLIFNLFGFYHTFNCLLHYSMILQLFVRKIFENEKKYLLKLFSLQGINPKLEFSTNTTMQEASIVGSFQRFHATATLSASEDEDEELVSTCTHRSILSAIWVLVINGYRASHRKVASSIPVWGSETFFWIWAAHRPWEHRFMSVCCKLSGGWGCAIR